MWLLVSNAEKESQKEPLLRCTHNKADDRIMFHLSHGVKVDKFKSIVIASPDRHVFVCSIHNYGKGMYFGLEELWFVTGLSTCRTFAHVHEAVDILESDVIEILPSVHALTRCDSTSVIASKKSALRVARTIGHEYLHSFGTIELTYQIITDTKIFLVKKVYHLIVLLAVSMNYNKRPTMIKNSILIWRNFLQQVKV